jgi:hypothetical protein
MKKISLVILLLALVCYKGHAQSGTIQGAITSVKPHFANTILLQVGDTELILTRDPKDKSGKAFDITKKYKDLVLEKEGQYILNPKFSGKTFSFGYTVNGKGWKCIQTVKSLRK